MAWFNQNQELKKIILGIIKETEKEIKRIGVETI
jgi:hypothetical protein